MSGPVDVTENMEVNIIIKEIESRLSEDRQPNDAVEQTHGYVGTLNKQGRDRIQKFLQWVSDENKCELSSIKLRPREHQLFGTCPDDKKTNFKAANLYAELFYDIAKTSDDVSYPLKFDITLNKEITNQSLIEEDGDLKEKEDGGAPGAKEKSGEPDPERCFRYGVVTLGEKPVLYLLYIDPTKDFDFID